MRRCLLLASLTSLLFLPCTTGKNARPQEPRGNKKAEDRLRQAAMKNAGNPQRGKTVFASVAAKCAACHKAQGEGSDLGPDLSQIGGKFDRSHLIESILGPS